MGPRSRADRPHIFILLALALSGGCARRDLKPSLDETSALKGRIESNVRPQFVRGDKESLNLWKIVTSFYSSSNYTFIGIIENSPVGIESIRL
jgi:hypothetical protein